MVPLPETLLGATSRERNKWTQASQSDGLNEPAKDPWRKKRGGWGQVAFQAFGTQGLRHPRPGGSSSAKVTSQLCPVTLVTCQTQDQPPSQPAEQPAGRHAGGTKERMVLPFALGSLEVNEPLQEKAIRETFHYQVYF